MTAAEKQTAVVETREPSLLDRIAEEQAHVAARYMPSLTVAQFIERDGIIRNLKEMLLKDVDYGVIPGTDKPVLLKPGAEKICMFFGYVPNYSIVAEIEDWTGEKHNSEPLFYFRYSCVLEKDRAAVGTAEGSCNSWESKYRYRWVQDVPANADKDKLLRRDSTITEFAFAIEKSETGGQYGKPKDYWDKWKAAIESGDARRTTRKTKAGKEMDAFEMGGTQYRVSNPDFADVINTCQKMGQKRAMISAVLSATGLSAYFTVDLEDMPEFSGAAPAAAANAAAVADPKTQANANPAKSAQADALPVPEELQQAVKKLREGDHSVIKLTSEYLQKELIAVQGASGDTTYLRRTEALRKRFPRGTAIPPEDMIATWLMLHADLEAARALKAGGDAFEEHMADNREKGGE